MPLEMLPVGWTTAKLPDLIGHDGVFADGDWIETEDQDPGGDVRLVQLADVGDGVFRDRSKRFLTSIKAAELNCTFLQRGDVLIARMPDPLGRACVFPGDSRKSVTAVDVSIVRPGADGVDLRWLMWTINAPQFRRAITEMQSGTTRGRISRKNLGRIPLPVPPVAEQGHIVAAIEEHFSRIDAGVQALERARRNLQRMRAAVLQAAVMGRLVPQDFEAEHGEILVKRLLDKHPEARNHTITFDAHSLPKLPDGWAWLAVGQLGEVVTGRTPDTQRIEYFGPGLPFVTPGDLGEELILRGAARELTEAGAAVARRLPVNSVLVTCIGATIGKVGLAAAPCATNQQINALIPFESYALPRWVCYAMASPWFFGLLRSQASSTTMPILNKSRFQALPMPLPPIAEQVRIVTEVERHLSFFDNLKVAVGNNVEHAAQLRRSILSSAFGGRLVPQDHSDEPASGLLERMRAARIARESRNVRSNRRPRR